MRELEGRRRKNEERLRLEWSLYGCNGNEKRNHMRTSWSLFFLFHYSFILLSKDFWVIPCLLTFFRLTLFTFLLPYFSQYILSRHVLKCVSPLFWFLACIVSRDILSFFLPFRLIMQITIICRERQALPLSSFFGLLVSLLAMTSSLIRDFPSHWYCYPCPHCITFHFTFSLFVLSSHVVLSGSRVSRSLLFLLVHHSRRRRCPVHAVWRVFVRTFQDDDRWRNGEKSCCEGVIEE